MKKSKFASSILIVAISAAFLGCASTASHESTGEYVDDTLITSKVKASILNDPMLKVTEINVETYKGVVQLSGFVKSPAEASQAVADAQKVDGVKSVKNDIRLK